MKLTTQVMDQSAQIQLNNELLNSYVYFFNQNHPDVRFNKKIMYQEKKDFYSFRLMYLF